ncbi:hypothetical protein DAI22_12g039800 [Oryza sativa Japonica Group]|nr:hypothetical protein DAI22_12g039800 [Oryza sativa Japonica Group]
MRPRCVVVSSLQPHTRPPRRSLLHARDERESNPTSCQREREVVDGGGGGEAAAASAMMSASVPPGHDGARGQGYAPCFCSRDKVGEMATTSSSEVSKASIVLCILLALGEMAYTSPAVVSVSVMASQNGYQ